MAYTKEEWRAYAKKWRAANPDKVAAYARKSREAAADKPKKTPRRRGFKQDVLVGKYGITTEDRARMLDVQGGNCAICEDPMDRPNIDHCHASGKVRGLLCRHCNLGLGHFKDNADRLYRAAAYLQET